MNNQIRIVPEKNEDRIYEVFEELSDAFYRKDVDKKQLAKKLSRFGAFQIPFYDAAVAGFVGYYMNDSLSKVAFLSTIVVSPGFHRGGIGTFLLYHCLRECNNSGMLICRLEVEKSNLDAIRFYKKLGFLFEREATELSDYYFCKLSNIQ